MTDAVPNINAIQAEPLVSVIVPAYNAEATISATLASVAQQSHRSLEILIVDDGSTDATASIAQAFCDQDQRARLVSQENNGVAAARNRGLALACGDFVAPLDADDLWHPDKLARQISLARESGADFVSCWFRDIDETDAVWRDGPQPRHSGTVYLRMLMSNFVGNGSALLVRREAALQVRGYDESLRAEGRQGCEDILFQIRLAEHHIGAVVPAYLVGYRKRSGAMSADPLAMFHSWLAAREQIDSERREARTALRWTMAGRRIQLAEALAWRRRWLLALRHAAAAAMGDPHRTALALVRLIARRWSNRPARQELPAYHSLDADIALFPAVDDALSRLEDRRNSILARHETRRSGKC